MVLLHNHSLTTMVICRAKDTYAWTVTLTSSSEYASSSRPLLVICGWPYSFSVWPVCFTLMQKMFLLWTKLCKLNTLIGIRVSFTMKKSPKMAIPITTSLTYIFCMRLRACVFEPNFKLATKRRHVHVLRMLSQVLRTLLMSQLLPSHPTARLLLLSPRVRWTLPLTILFTKWRRGMHVTSHRGVADLSKLRCNGCEIDHPSQRQLLWCIPPPQLRMYRGSSLIVVFLS